MTNNLNSVFNSLFLPHEQVHYGKWIHHHNNWKKAIPVLPLSTAAGIFQSKLWFLFVAHQAGTWQQAVPVCFHKRRPRTPSAMHNRTHIIPQSPLLKWNRCTRIVSVLLFFIISRQSDSPLLNLQFRRRDADQFLTSPADLCRPQNDTKAFSTRLHTNSYRSHREGHHDSILRLVNCVEFESWLWTFSYVTMFGHEEEACSFKTDDKRFSGECLSVSVLKCYLLPSTRNSSGHGGQSLPIALLISLFLFITNAVIYSESRNPVFKFWKGHPLMSVTL